jgi:glycosyltransferase involved in cell wall biosynthesis
MHMSGALYKPAIVVAGAREPVSFTQYPGHRYLATDGCLPCAATTACWHCAIDTCTDLVDGKEKTPRCVDLITPADLTRALEMYYRGGRLKKGVPCAKPKLKNIVKAPVAIPKVPSVDVAKYGMTFGGGCITEPDWEFMQQVIRDHGVRRVLEFGTGLSTLLMTDLGIDVETYETMPGWVDRIRAINPKSNINLWDGVNLDLGDKRYDMVFVDGPAGGRSREASTRIAAEHAPVVLVHDAGREWEKLWQEKYLHGKFSGPGKGGSRCHLWIRDGGAVKTEPITGVCSVEKRQTEGESGQGTCADDRGTTRPAGGKSVKIVSTARGWGGCARSVTTIMKFLTAAGHRVEFIPFRNKVASREYGEFLRQHPEIRVTETYDTVREACDVLFVYADDYVWEFGKPEVADIFSGLGAERKVMMLNYRRGSVGSIPWTQGWDKYMFLNSSQEQELLKILPGVRTKVLPPCTELEAFLAVQPKYDGMLHIVRHSSQGDTKFASSIADEIDTVLHRAGATIDMLPGPSFVQSRNRFTKHPRTDKPEVIAQFLAMGNIFWYSLPDGYMDMGPRVILEAMAAGLPVVADNWGGAPDRVTSDCGWICGSKDEMVKVLLNVDMTELEYKGMAARARAIDEFVPQRWIDEVLS